MATNAPRRAPVVRSSERLWSEEVASADPPDLLDPTEKTYEFSKPGRTFTTRDRDRYTEPDA